MRHAEFTTSIPSLTPTAATAPTAPIGNGGGKFGGIFNEVQGEVTDFIQNGGGDFASEEPGKIVKLRSRVLR